MEESLIKKKFDLFFQKLSIAEPIDNKKTLISGFGKIKQLENKFEFDLFVKRSKVKIDYESIKQAASDEEGYITLKGLDVEGNIWIFSCYSLGVKFFFNKSGLVTLSGTTSSISKREKLKVTGQINYLEFNFLDSFIFPFNSNEYKNIKIDDKFVQIHDRSIINFKYRDIHIRGAKKEGMVNIFFEKKKIEKNFEVRIIESLKFITGQQIKPISIKKKVGSFLFTKLYSDFEKDVKIYVPPPLEYYDYSNSAHNDCWKIFYHFLLRISDFKEKKYSPLGTEVNAIIGAGATFYEVTLLVIGVRIEGLAKKLFPNLGKPDEASIQEISELIEYISDWEKSVQIKKRAVNVLGNLKKIRIQDKLKELVEIGVINKKHLVAWTKLRNKSAHPTSEKDDNWIKKLQNQYWFVLDMYYRMILYGINYSGKYTSYIEPRFQRIDFQLFDFKN